MKTHTATKVIKTTCGKIISYFEKDGAIPKMHCMDGPAIIHPEGSKKASEYYIYGIKYSKSKWQELISQHKAVFTGEPMNLEF